MDNLPRISPRKLIVGSILLLLLGFWAWLHYTTQGQLWQIRQELAYWKKNTPKYRYNTYRYRSASVTEVIASLYNSIDSSDPNVAKALALIPEIYGSGTPDSSTNDPSRREKHFESLKEALIVAQQIDKSKEKAEVLIRIAHAYIKLSDSTQDPTVLKQALTVAQQKDKSKDKGETLIEIAQAYIKLSDSTQAVAVLKQALTVAQEIDSFYFQTGILNEIAEAYIKLSESTQDQTKVKHAQKRAHQIMNSRSKGETLIEIAEAYIKLSDSTQDPTLLKQSLIPAEQIDDSEDKVEILTKIAQGYIKLSDSKEALTIFKQALNVIQDSHSLFPKTEQQTAIVIEMAETQAKLQRWGDALKTTKKCRLKYNDNSQCRVESLSKILRVYEEFENAEFKEEGKQNSN